MFTFRLKERPTQLLKLPIGKRDSRLWYFDISHESWDVLDDDLGPEKVFGCGMTHGGIPSTEIVAKAKHELHRLCKYQKVEIAGKVQKARWVFPRTP